MMNMAVVGTGYVGLVAGACFADSGHHVICVDCDADKVRRLSVGEVPIFEPGLAEIVQRSAKAGRLSFTTDLAEAVKQSQILFLAVGTPQGDDGAANLNSIFEVVAQIGRHMDGHRILVMKSTVPVGTHARVAEVLSANTRHSFDYVSNPEFMKEGAAIEDFMRPDRVVIGASSPAAAQTMLELYRSFMRRDERILQTDPASAEMIKYAANAMLATRISFMNEISGLCERLGADIESVRRGVGTDARIGSAFLYPGVGFGGSCFPKDLSALIHMGESLNYPMSVAKAVSEVNQRQRERFARRVVDHFEGRARPVTLAIWGLAFKARTDDVRESPALSGVKMFQEHGFTLRAHDPEAMRNAAGALGPTVAMCDDAYETLEGADALVIFTDWPEFRTPDFDLMTTKLRGRVIFDGRNLYEPAAMAQRGFRYVCIGRPTVAP